MDIDLDFTDTDLETEGVWVEYKNGTRLKLARLGNPNFQRLYNAKMKPFVRRQRQGDLDPQIELEVSCDCLAKTVITDWEGFTKNKKALKYTPAVGKELLMRSMDFRADVTAMSDSQENYRAANFEDAEKN